MDKKIKIEIKKKKFEIKVCECGFFGKTSGLMFRSRNTKNLLFGFVKKVRGIHVALHSWFVFFDFYVLWLDNKNRVVEYRRIKPFSTVILCSKYFRSIVEIPINETNKKLIRVLDGK